MYCVLLQVHSLFQNELSEIVICSFFFQFLVFSGFLKVVCLLPTSSSSSSFRIYPSPCLSCNNVFRRQFLCKMWPVQLAFLVFVVCRMFLSSLTPCNTSLAQWETGNTLYYVCYTLLCIYFTAWRCLTVSWNMYLCRRVNKVNRHAWLKITC